MECWLSSLTLINILKKNVGIKRKDVIERFAAKIEDSICLTLLL